MVTYGNQDAFLCIKHTLLLSLCIATFRTQAPQKPLHLLWHKHFLLIEVWILHKLRVPACIMLAIATLLTHKISIAIATIYTHYTHNILLTTPSWWVLFKDITHEFTSRYHKYSSYRGCVCTKIRKCGKIELREFMNTPITLLKWSAQRDESNGERSISFCSNVGILATRHMDHDGCMDPKVPSECWYLPYPNSLCISKLIAKKTQPALIPPSLN